MDNPSANRPERRSALVARELERYKIDICAISETRLPNEGHLTEQKAGYTFYWSGKSDNERREAGVGLSITSKVARTLTSQPKGISDRLMSLRFPLTQNQHVTIISAYAPTMTNPEEVKDSVYEDLEKTIDHVPRTDKLIILGDFNARVGTDSQNLGRHHRQERPGQSQQ